MVTLSMFLRFRVRVVYLLIAFSPIREILSMKSICVQTDFGLQRIKIGSCLLSCKMTRKRNAVYCGMDMVLFMVISHVPINRALAKAFLQLGKSSQAVSLPRNVHDLLYCPEIILIMFDVAREGGVHAA